MSSLSSTLARVDCPCGSQDVVQEVHDLDHEEGQRDWQVQERKQLPMWKNDE